MPEVFLISDTHFGHHKILEFEESRRQLGKTIEEHDATLVERWNSVDGAGFCPFSLRCVVRYGGRYRRHEEVRADGTAGGPDNRTDAVTRRPRASCAYIHSRGVRSGTRGEHQFLESASPTYLQQSEGDSWE